MISKHERAYAVIRQRILDGTYKPGHRLVIDALASELGISPVPVREAIRRLEAEGRVVYRHNAGARVAPDPGHRGLRIGLDAGPVTTAAVLMDGSRVVHAVTAPSTGDDDGGLSAALAALLRDSGIETRAISAVMVGTTHFVSAVTQRRLAPAACIRLGLPATRALPPLIDWPDDPRAVVGNCWYLAHGGHEIDGRVLAPIDAAELRSIALHLRGQNIPSVALSSVFSPVTSQAEEQAEVLLRAAWPDIDLTLSHQVGGLGLLERENTAILNACLRPQARSVLGRLRDLIRRLGLVASLYLTRTDGTLMSAQMAERFPVLTFFTGQANVIRGAGILAGVGDGIVVRAGAASIELGLLIQGFPRQSVRTATVAGVRTNIHRPDVHAIHASTADGETGALRQAIERLRVLVERAPVVVVGDRASSLRTALAGLPVIVPDHHAVAGAVGAATAHVAADVERTVSLTGTSRREAVAAAVADAMAQATAAGADATTVRIVSAEDLPFGYLPDSITRVRVKAIGDLAAEALDGR